MDYASVYFSFGSNSVITNSLSLIRSYFVFDTIAMNACDRGPRSLLSPLHYVYVIHVLCGHFYEVNCTAFKNLLFNSIL